MSITFGNTASDVTQASGTVAYNNNGETVIVCINSTSNDISAVSYAGSSMTQIGTAYSTSWSSRFHSTWIKTGAAQGSNNIVVTGGTAWQFLMFSVSGLDSGTPTSAETTTGNLSATNPTVSVTTTVNGSYVIGVGQLQGSTPTAGANTSSLVSASGGSFYAFRSTSAVTDAGTNFTINVTAGSGGYNLRGFALNPPTVVASGATLMMMGI